MDITPILAAIPAAYDLYPALLIIACKIVTILVRPPAAGSRWAKAFSVLNVLALNIGWAANRLQVGKTGVMVRDAEVPLARQALARAGVTGFQSAPTVTNVATQRP